MFIIYRHYCYFGANQPRKFPLLPPPRVGNKLFLKTQATLNPDLNLHHDHTANPQIPN